MFQKIVMIGILMVGMNTLTAHASGQHEHGHDGAEQQPANDDHGHEGSPVGQPAPADKATKVINVITMDTMRYEFSSQPELEDGEIVRFVVTNQGKIAHEFSIGDEEEQNAHRKMMRNMPNMVHEDGNTITVKPGETKELTWQFRAGSEVIFACNVPGHFEAGMFEKATVGAVHEHGH